MRKKQNLKQKNILLCHKDFYIITLLLVIVKFSLALYYIIFEYVIIKDTIKQRNY